MTALPWLGRAGDGGDRAQGFAAWDPCRILDRAHRGLDARQVSALGALYRSADLLVGGQSAGSLPPPSAAGAAVNGTVQSFELLAVM